MVRVSGHGAINLNVHSRTDMFVRSPPHFEFIATADVYSRHDHLLPVLSQRALACHVTYNSITHLLRHRRALTIPYARLATLHLTNIGLLHLHSPNAHDVTPQPLTHIMLCSSTKNVDGK